MKIALVQQNYHIGNFEFNAEKIIQGIHLAKEAGADLVVFSELCICGYPPRDFLEFKDFIHQCEASINKIIPYCDDIAAIVGSPCLNEKLEGKELFNVAYFIADKKIN